MSLWTVLSFSAELVTAKAAALHACISRTSNLTSLCLGSLFCRKGVMMSLHRHAGCLTDSECSHGVPVRIMYSQGKPAPALH